MRHQGAFARRPATWLALVMAVVVSACTSMGGGAVDTTTAATPGPVEASSTTIVPTTDVPGGDVVADADPVCTEPLIDEVVLADTSELANPDTGSDSWPAEGRYERWDVRDGPESSYRPCFVPADQSAFDDDTVVLGLAIGDEARAYAIEQLVGHHVNDRFDDDPLLVSY